VPRNRRGWGVWLGLLAFQLAGGAAPGNARTTVDTALSHVQAPRAQALGGAVAALEGDPALLWVSPATAARLNSAFLALAGRRGRFDEISGQGLWATPLPTGVLALGALYFDAGVATITASDGSSRSVNLQQDVVGLLSYSVAPFQDIIAGVTLKGLRSEQFGQTTGALAGDGGVQFYPDDRLTGGLLVQNLGTSLRYFEDRFELPTTVRAGLAWSWPLGADAKVGDRILLLSDAEYAVLARVVFWRGGLEYRWREIAALRAGVYAGPQRKVFSAGFGFHVSGFQLDYSAQFGGFGDLPHSMSLSYVFGKRAVKAQPTLAAPAPRPQLALPVVRLRKAKAMKATLVLNPKQLAWQAPIKEWKVEIVDENNRVVKTVVGTGSPPKTLDWDGLDDRGALVVDVAKTRLVLKMKDVNDRLIEEVSVVPAVSAEPQLKAVAGQRIDPEVVFGLPQDRYQGWQLQMYDGGTRLAAWEGKGVPDASIRWSGRDEAGNPAELAAPYFRWKFISEQGVIATGERKLPQVEVVTEVRATTRHLRLFGVSFTGRDAELTTDHWMVLAKAAKLLVKTQERTLHIRSYADVKRQSEAHARLEALRGKKIFHALTEQFKIPAARIDFTPRTSKKPRSRFESPRGSELQRVQQWMLEIVERR